MGKFNTLATKILLAGTAAGGVAMANPFDDVIAGCLKTDEGRLHFQMDDGSVSAEPIQNLRDAGNDECIVSHGSTEQDVYQRVDVVGSDYAVNLVEAAAAFSNTEWETIQPELEAHQFETFTAFLDGSDIVLMDESGEPATGILAMEFTDTMMPVSLGDETSAAMMPDELTAGSAVFANETDEGIQVARVPAVNMAVQPN